MDALIKAIEPKARIRFTMADVTMSAKALEARHLSGPTASMALAEGLAAVALMTQDSGHADEAVMLRLHVSGPIRGLLVEATGAGTLRGFTHAKILNDLDGAERIDTEAAWGNSGAIHVIVSRPGVILSRAALHVNPPRMQRVLARYFNFSLQTPTAAELFVKADSGGLIRACGILAQRMADTDTDAFVRVLECFERKAVQDWLADGANLARLAALLGLTDVERHETRPLSFLCRCTREKTVDALSTLTQAELESLVARGASQTVTCHMCAKSYTAGPDDIRAVLARKSQNPPPGACAR
jgi:molecular chaperone Hsp33